MNGTAESFGCRLILELILDALVITGEEYGTVDRRTVDLVGLAWIGPDHIFDRQKDRGSYGRDHVLIAYVHLFELMKGRREFFVEILDRHVLLCQFILKLLLISFRESGEEKNDSANDQRHRKDDIEQAFGDQHFLHRDHNEHILADKEFC